MWTTTWQGWCEPSIQPIGSWAVLPSPAECGPSSWRRWETCKLLLDVSVEETSVPWEFWPASVTQAINNLHIFFYREKKNPTFFSRACVDSRKEMRSVSLISVQYLSLKYSDVKSYWFYSIMPDLFYPGGGVWGQGGLRMFFFFFLSEGT